MEMNLIFLNSTLNALIQYPLSPELTCAVSLPGLSSCLEMTASPAQAVHRAACRSGASKTQKDTVVPLGGVRAGVFPVPGLPFSLKAHISELDYKRVSPFKLNGYGILFKDLEYCFAL